MPQATPIDLPTLRRMLRRAYGAPFAPTGDGFAHWLGTGRNRVVRCELANGQLVVLKVAPGPDEVLPSHEVDLLRGEVEALQMIAEHTGVPVPAMHHVDASHELVEADWFAMEYLPGTAHGELPEPLQHQVGAALRELNAIQGNEFGRFLQPTLDSWRDAFSGLFEDALDDATRLGTPLGVDADELYRVVIEHSPALDAVTEPRFCEWLLDAHDVLVADGRITGLLGHGHVFWGDPLMQAALAGTGRPGHPDHSAGFDAGYAHPQPLDPQELERRMVYDVFHALLTTVTGTPQGSGPGLSVALEALAQLD